jgi:uncharacterized protein with FMN-binding domain
VRRAVLTLGGTLAGLAALLAFKFQPAATPSAPEAGTTVAPLSAGATPAAGAARPSATAKATGGAGKARPSATAKATGGAGGGTGQAAAARTFTGAVDDTQYGPMQVQITVSGTKITKVTVLQQTDDGAMSQQVDAMAIPTLTSEALAAQSASIDAVSGASYTSAGYIKSLQSAIDEAGL